MATKTTAAHIDVPLATKSLSARYEHVRKASMALTEPLEADDFMIQSMPDVSPAKWHLAHVNWFFETFVLTPFQPGYQVFDQQLGALFNSYYNAVGAQYPRPRRGLLCRPTLKTVLAWREHVDAHMHRLLDSDQLDRALVDIVVLGLNHEQQHQELLLMDIKHGYSVNPLYPSYRERRLPRVAASITSHWCRFAGGTAEFGHDGSGFSFDNELPRHQAILYEFELASRLVSNGEYAEFIRDGGYRDPLLWLSDGLDWVQENAIDSPLYWHGDNGGWSEFTLYGLAELDLSAPVCHISYYEADAYARWAQARLPDEYELEQAGTGTHQPGNFVETGRLHPGAAKNGLCQLHGDAWEWTRSAFGPYPGYHPARGALGEYNAKFMCNQMVMRGGSALTPHDHFRNSYRNFFYPRMRWQMGGIRLARDCV